VATIEGDEEKGWPIERRGEKRRGRDACQVCRSAFGWSGRGFGGFGGRDVETVRYSGSAGRSTMSKSTKLLVLGRLDW
jgi:hypothetical protein